MPELLHPDRPRRGNPNGQPIDAYNLGNGSITDVDQRSVIDAGFLELVRLGVLPANDPTIESSLTVVDDTIERQTPSGPGFYRYGTTPTESVDGYGDCLPAQRVQLLADRRALAADRHRAPGTCGRCCRGERGEYDDRRGRLGVRRPAADRDASMTSGQGLEPEQVWEDPDLPASPFGTDPDHRLDRLQPTASRPARPAR